MRPTVLLTLIFCGALHAANTSDTQRWTATATSGGSLELGSPLTLTWSIVPDGLSLPTTYTNAAANPNPQSDLIARMDTLFNVPAAQRIADLTQRPWFATMASRFAIYASKTGLTYQYVADDAAGWGSGGKTSAPTRGDIRIGGTALTGVFGYNGFPNNGDMILNTSGTTFANEGSLKVVFGHEHAHGLGLGHVLVQGNGANSVVSGSGGNVNGPQLDDLLVLQRKYGDFFEKSGGNDTPATATPLGAVSSSQPARRGMDIDDILISAAQTDIVSIDDDSDSDWFSFTLANPLETLFIVTPRGPTYDYGPEGGSTVTLNAAAQSDLSFVVRNSGGTTLATVNAKGVGNAESTVLSLPAGTYTVGVSGAANKAQFYSIEVLPASLDSDADGIADVDEPPGDIDGDGLENRLDPDSDGDGIQDGAELAKRRDPYDRRLFFLFHEDADPEGWTGDVQMGPVTTNGGSLTGTTVQADPKLRSPALRIDSSLMPKLAFRIRSNVGGPCQLYWMRVGTAGEGVSPVPALNLVGDGQFHTLVFDLASHPDWNGKIITGLRFDPVNKAGATIAIDRIWATDGDYDDDGVPDEMEALGDADDDGLENFQDPDSDNDGLDDGVEIAKGRDPLDGVIYFGFDGDAEGWTASADVGVPVISGSTYDFTSTGADPQLSREGPVFSGDAIRGVIVRMKAPQSSRVDLFFGTKASPGIAAERKITTNFTGSPGYQWVYLNAGAHPQWDGATIVRLRLDPTALSSATVSLDTILTSGGDYDGDGIPDEVEGTGDPDGDGIPNLLDTDSDGDGAPDALETQFGRNPYSAAEAVADADGDGYTDLFELIAGTDPDAAADAPRAAISAEPQITISGRAGRTYQLQRGAAGSLAGWGNIGSPVAAAADGTISVGDPLPPAGRAFYRFAISLTAP